MAASEQIRKTENLSARLRPDELALIGRGASLRNVKISEYVVSSAMIQAEIDLMNQTEFILPDDKALAFLEALDRTARPKPELVKLFTTKTPFD